MMHIALTIDSKFVRYCAVTIVSILENNDPKDIMLHIVSGHLPKEDILTLSQVAEKYGTSIAFYYIPHEKLQNYEVVKEDLFSDTIHSSMHSANTYGAPAM